MKFFFYVLSLCLLVSAGWCSEELVLNDQFEGNSVGIVTGVTFVNGKDGKGAALKSATDSIEYSANYFPTAAGRIEFDVMFPQQIPTERRFWTFLSDVGAGSAYLGALNVHFRDENNKLEFGIYDGATHHWCISKTSSWEPGRWYHVALHYGMEGMKLYVDDVLEDSNEYAQGLSKSPKRLGYHDSWVDAPLAVFDNLRTYRINRDNLDLSSAIFSPKGLGLFDDSAIEYELQNDGTVTLELLSKEGKLQKRIINNKRTDSGLHQLKWNPKGVEDGAYDLQMTIKRNGKSETFRTNLIVNTKWKWKEVEPLLNDFIPTGMYYFWEDDATYINRYVEDSEKAREYYEYTIKDNAEHGIDLLMMVWTPKDRLQMVLDIAHKYNVKVIIHLSEISHALASEESFYGHNILETVWDSIKDIKDHPALLGYYIIDEPSNSSDMAKRISDAKKILEAMDPNHPAFSCLLGGYEELLKTVGYQSLVIDIYPIRPNWSENLTGFEAEVQRGVRNADGKPVWVIPQAFGKPNVWLVPTPEELNGQVWVSLANGAKGIVYFIYQSTTGIQGEWLRGLVDMELNPIGEGLEAIKKINADVKKLAPLLLRLKSSDFEIKAETDKLTIKGYVDDAKNRYVFIVNKDVKNKVPAKWISEPATDMLTGAEVSGGFDMEPGAGLLLKIK